jgi:hypothetical protein
VPLAGKLGENRVDHLEHRGREANAVADIGSVNGEHNEFVGYLPQRLAQRVGLRIRNLCQSLVGPNGPGDRPCSRQPADLTSM